MAVIKSKNSDSVLKSAVVLDLGDLKHQADEMMRNAERRADEMLNQAKSTAEKEFKQASEKGYAKGYQEGLAKGHQDGINQGKQEAMAATQGLIQEVAQHWDQVSQNIEANRELLAQQARESLMMLSLKLAEKILHRELHINREATLDALVMAAIQAAMGASHVTIRMCEKDARAIEEYLPQIKSRFNHLKQLALLPDVNLTDGQVMLDQKQGAIDVSIDQALDKVIEVILPASLESPDPKAASSQQNSAASESEKSQSTSETEGDA